DASVGNIDNASCPYLGQSTAVGGYAPNVWGLYDMHGNVWEWCQDWWSPALPGGTVTDPLGSSTGTKRVIRGGSWHSGAWNCRSASRYDYAPADASDQFGFRVVL